MDGKSLDLTAEKLAQLRDLFPEVFSEGKVDFARLKDILGENVIFPNEHYELSWAGKAEARKEIQKQTTNTLIADKEGSIDFENAQNLFIEGENLEVLRILQKSYFGKVKMIYIDPPYNTGNDSFVYPDDYSERQEEYNKRTGVTDEEGYLNKQDLWHKNTRENGQFHSVWLSMMYPRLYLARNLLREDGMIFVSIDDNEVNDLKLLMDEIFGEENFVGTFVINSSPSAIDYGHIAKMHDYVIFYARNLFETDTSQLPEKDKEFKYSDQVGPFNIYPLYNGNVAFNPSNRPNLYYPFYLNPKNEIENGFYEISLEKKAGWVEVFPVVSRKDGIQRIWRWGKEKSQKDLNKEIIGYKTEDGEFRVVQKARHTGKVIRSIQSDQDVSSRRGTSEVEKLFGSKIFSFPKPTELIKKFLNVSTEEDDIVLDFFAGSGTTAHAVLDLNEEDSGNRQFICVQMPELLEENSEAYKAGYHTIADISKARISKVIEKLQKARAEQLALESKPQILGFRSFKIAPSNFKNWRGDAEGEELLKQLDFLKQSEKDGSLHENMLMELLLKDGRALTAKVETLKAGKAEAYLVEDGRLFLFFGGYNKSIKELIHEKAPKRVVCLDSAFKGKDEDISNFKLELKEAGIELSIL